MLSRNSLSLYYTRTDCDAAMRVGHQSFGVLRPRVFEQLHYVSHTPGVANVLSIHSLPLMFLS